MTSAEGRPVRAIDAYRADVELLFSASAQDGRPSVFQFMEVDHPEICRRFSLGWDTLATLADDMPDHFREEYGPSGTGQPYIWSVLGREAADGAIELLSLTIEWLDGRSAPPVILE